MSACTHCHKPITSAQRRSMVEIRVDGKLKGAAHGKCDRVATRRATNDAQAESGLPPRAGRDAPTAYQAAAQFDDRRTDAEYAAARAASADLSEERAKDLDERRHDNWRNERQASIEDLTTSTGEVLELDAL